MRCMNCGYVYVGNFCPKCGKKAVDSKNKTELNAPMNSVYSKPERNMNEPKTVNTPVREEVDYRQTPSDDIQRPVYPQPAPPKKGWTSGKIVALVVPLALAALLLMYAVPLGIFFVTDSIDNAKSEFYKNKDKNTAPYSSDAKVKMGSFEYSLENISFSDKYKCKTADKGYEYLFVDVKAKNTSEDDAEVFASFTCYADKVLVNNLSEADYGNELEPDMAEMFNLVFKVPKDRDKVLLNISVDEDNMLFSRNVKFEIKS